MTIPIGFLGCWLGTMLSRERDAERSFNELRVRAETGIGSEAGPETKLRARRPGRREAETSLPVGHR